MPLADEFQEIVDALPSDWTDMELDLRVAGGPLHRRRDTIAQVNGQPYSNHDWHWRLLVAHQFGHAAAAPAVHGTLRLLDETGIRGELKLRDYRTGRVETTQMWGRPESVRQEFRRLRPVVAPVVALFDDLLLGSNVLGMLRAAGHEARLTGDAAAVNPDGAAVLIVDLASPGFDGVAVVEELRAGGELGDTRTLGVYSHVDVDTKRRADAAGFDLVVPRSRMAREGPQLVERLAGA